jgi:hypothetical protein
MNVKGDNGKHNHSHPPKSHDSHTPVMKSDLMEVCWETQDMINGLRIAINTHAEIMMLHRHLLEKFIPAPVLEAAVNEYAKTRREQIEAERLAAQAAENPSNVAQTN